MRDAVVAQLVKCPTLAQVRSSQFLSTSLALGSVLTTQSLEPASDSVSPSLSAPPLLALCLSVCLSLSLSQKYINIKKNFKNVYQMIKLVSFFKE